VRIQEICWLKSYATEANATKAAERVIDAAKSITGMEPAKVDRGLHWFMDRHATLGRYAPVFVIVDPDLIFLARSIAERGHSVWN
jgi:hypothetical protein